VAVLNEEGNAAIARLVQSMPHRFSGLAVANPWYGGKALEMVDRAFADGLCGLYLDPARQGFKLTESVVAPLLERCARLGKPVYCHTGTLIFAEPFQLAEWARQFPDIPFIMGHAGFSDYWYDVVPAALQAPNVLVESSCTTGGQVADFIGALGRERVLFGSGYPESLPENEVEKVRLAGLPPEARAALFRENACRVWGIQA
jgi:predicted TIM-barrel fold metal-dependent hydrolase